MNNPNAWLQFALYVAALLLITKPLGLYLVRVLDSRGKTWLDPVVKPIERLTYRLCGEHGDPRDGQTSPFRVQARRPCDGGTTADGLGRPPVVGVAVRTVVKIRMGHRYSSVSGFMQSRLLSFTMEWPVRGVRGSR